jgi:hypothetical protein
MSSSLTIRDLRRLWKPHKERLGSHPTAIRFHRACSWLARTEKLDPAADSDLILLSQWIALNCLYGRWDATRREPCADRESWRSFFSRVLRLDAQSRLAGVLIDHKRLVVSLLEEEYLSQFFWRDPGHNSKQQARYRAQKAHARYVEKAWTLILDELVDRIYFLRCQLVHGAATYGGKLNRIALRRSSQMLGHLLPAVLLVYVEHGADEDWGQLCYPPITAIPTDRQVGGKARRR